MAFDASQFMSPTGSEYEITNSLRMNGNADLDRTPDASNRKTYTLSAWVKRSGLTHASKQISLMDVYVDTNNFTRIVIESDDKLQILSRVSNQNTLALNTSPLLRDVSAWYHIVVAVDTTDGTANDRVKIYINGVEAPVASRTNPDQNYDGHINAAVLHDIGKSTDTSYDGYLAEYNFIDGLALAPAAFGETGDYGEWKPIKYAGAYGDEGFYLDFKSSGVGTAGSGTVGADRSGNGNHYTSSNIAVTDQMPDSPTNNFATLNPLVTGGGALTLDEGNLGITGFGSARQKHSTIMPDSGKWYAEFLMLADMQDVQIGIANPLGTGYLGNTANSWGMISATGNRINSGSQSSYGSAYVNGGIIGVALDLDNGKVFLAENNTYNASGNPVNGDNPMYAFGYEGCVGFAVGSNDTGGDVMANFGQDSSFAGNKTAQGNQDANAIGDFFYAPPSGFLALCTKNLPEPAVIPSENFNTVLYTGNGADDRSITGVGFASDLIWNKARSNSNSHRLFDRVRGGTKALSSDNSSAEYADNGVKSFLSDGFVTSKTGGNSNDNNFTYASWNWKANGAGASNTDGSINTTKTSANVDAGFSIITYSGNNTAGATIGHGLSKAPEMVVIKSITNANDWWDTYHYAIGANFSLFLNTTNAALDRSYFHDTHPSDSLIYLGSDRSSNGPSENFVAYAWHSVDGFSKVGSYTGVGGTDGIFVYTGFRPAFVFIKRSNSAGQQAPIYDSARDTSNVAIHSIKSEDAAAEFDNQGTLDLLSNGFKARNNEGSTNTNGGIYIYLAFAESPFKHSNAR